MPDPSSETSPSVPPADPVLALVRDLMFVSRVSGTARDVHVPLKVVRDPAALAGQPGRRLVVDLNLDGAIDAAAAWKRATGGAVVGFVSHVDADTTRRAREAGVDRVIARSRFVQVLPELLGGAAWGQAGDDAAGDPPASGDET